MARMGAFPRYVICGLSLLHALVAGSPLRPGAVPRYFQNAPFTRRDLSVTTVQQELGGQLSHSSTIYGSSSPAWTNATERWNTLSPPDVEVVVQPGEESDIPIIVKYCNDNSIEFLAVNRGHGLTTSLGAFKGLEIDLQSLTGITIQPGKKSAILQAGTYGIEVMQTLWDEGYVTPTGSNECVGFMGPALGGGHGRFEGLYGLISDNFVHLNVVLANGSEIGVNATSYDDLFWAMKGAGHNFGIVTSAEVKIYPREVDTWHYHNYYWTQDKLETVFEKLNIFHGNGTTPPRMGVNFGQISINSSISSTEASLFWTFAYDGPAADAEKLLEPFNAIDAVAEEIGDLPYPEIPGVQGTSVASGSCSSNTYAIGTTMLHTYNVSAERQNYNYFNEEAAKYPDLAATARLYYEGYATKAAQAVDPTLSAYPHRDKLHILFFATAVPAGSNLLDPAEAWAKESRSIWNGGEPKNKPTVYVNYATGDETLESVYGEKWRLDKLRGLKTKYDPNNRFRYFVPIVSQ
ncbi:hypothetical protein GGR54DRAFT_606504 [Hypoxylon sp. NC1633]|nr:hypothetical protein GGR54DRAFT_606504 [Hypoxylon sp. NC1633]